MEFFTYIAKSAGILTLFYIVYALVLRKDTFFSAKRTYLLIGIIASLLLPFLTITTTTVVESPVSYAPEALSELIPMAVVKETPVKNHIDVYHVIFWTYVLGIGIMLTRFFVQLNSLIRLLTKHPSTKIGGYRFVTIEETIAPFSFFHYIVFNPETHEQSELEMILQHEKVHASQWHSIDLIVSNFIRSLQWINPISWFYKKSIEANLEFLADHRTVSALDSKTDYQMALLRASSPLPVPALTNNFYHSFIKKRIIMLNKSNSNKYNQFKLALVLPALAFFLWSFNTEEVVTFVTDTNAENPVDATTTSGHESIPLSFSATSSEAELNALENYFMVNHPESLVKIADRKRNTAGELSTFSFKTKFKGEDRFYTRFDRGPGAPFQTAYTIEPLEKGVLLVSEIGKNEMQFKVTKEQLQMIASGDKSLNIKSKSVTAKDSVKVAKPMFGEDPLYIINGKEYRKKELPVNKTIELDGTVEAFNQKDGQEKYGIKGKDGVLFFNGHATFTPTPKNTTQAIGTAKKRVPSKVPSSTKEIRIKITKNTTKEELDGIKKELKELHDVDFNYSNVNYNDTGEMTSLSIQYTGLGNSGSYTISSGDDDAIDDLYFYLDPEEGKSGFVSGNSSVLQANRASRLAKRDNIRGEVNERRNKMMEDRRAALAEMKEARDEQRVEMKIARNELRRAERDKAVSDYKYRTKTNSNLHTNHDANIRTRQRDVSRATGYARRGIHIDKNTTDGELAKMKIDLAEKGIKFNYKRVRRNSNGEITGIKATFDNGEGNKVTKSVQSDDGEPIETIVIHM